MLNRSTGDATVKVSLAVIFTVASIFMIFGAWIVFRPSPDWNEDEGYRYNTWFATNAMLEPRDTIGYSFDASKGQMILVHVGAVYVPADQSDIMVNVPESISVTLIDFAGNKLVDVEKVQDYDTFEPVLIETTGEHRIEVVNNQDRLLSIGIRATSVEVVPVYQSFGLMITFMSLPIFLLGIWLFIVKKPRSY